MSTFIAPQPKLLGHLDRLQELREFGMTSAPINVEIDLSNRCSLGCDWCHFAHTHTRGPLKGKRPKPAGAIPGGDLMDTPLAFRIVDELVEAGVRSVTWSGGGEPTLHPDFDSIISYAKSAGIQQGLYTHGGHVDRARAELLKGALTWVYVSLDAANAAVYRRDKGVDRFQAACSAIRDLVAALGCATVGVGYLITGSNWRSAPAAADLACDLGADFIQFRPTILYDQDDPAKLIEATQWMPEALELLQAIESDRIEIDLDRFRMYQDWEGHGYTTCWWSGLQTVITPNGKVWTCANKREHPGAELGDLSSESFAEIWARRELAKVDDDCRVMCRGHIPNLALAEIFAARPHAEFV